MLFDACAADDGAQPETSGQRERGRDDHRPDRAEGVVPWLASTTVGLAKRSRADASLPMACRDYCRRPGQAGPARPADHDRQLTLEVHR